MRHRKAGKRLNRDSSHRKSMMRNMSVSLIRHEIIKTTLEKAKTLRRFVEPIINSSKEKSSSNYRYAIKMLKNKKVVLKLFERISEMIGKRNGGYTRIIKCGSRKGDNANMAYIEIIDRKK
ncbi:50S ribosomal protein L17 [Candidatus Riesia pediculischaeffi]|uniref:Large ribosomal subunit protein bL17 n=1 Tax=Candidatus Riesia pediculischaeffi PTSU TaxID=1401651 RepID=A0A0C1S9Y9_9ENTR|nr:50S ribosomal protein L17 [Candidatus Riesia pediculischaeffi]KIE64121.1 LSU ribosomal protein L17p [Candidatus Riesia pediculischaeffi PTSU]